MNARHIPCAAIRSLPLNSAGRTHFTHQLTLNVPNHLVSKINCIPSEYHGHPLVTTTLPLYTFRVPWAPPGHHYHPTVYLQSTMDIPWSQLPSHYTHSEYHGHPWSPLSSHCTPSEYHGHPLVTITFPLYTFRVPWAPPGHHYPPTVHLQSTMGIPGHNYLPTIHLQTTMGTPWSPLPSHCTPSEYHGHPLVTITFPLYTFRVPWAPHGHHYPPIIHLQKVPWATLVTPPSPSSPDKVVSQL